MCTISSKLKLCACATDAALTQLDSYWQLFRRDQSNTSVVMGEALLPEYLQLADFAASALRLEEVLNAATVFDRDHGLRVDDHLLIHLRPAPGQEHWVFCFHYQDGGWRRCSYDPFAFEEKYTRQAQGRVEARDAE